MESVMNASFFRITVGIVILSATLAASGCVPIAAGAAVGAVANGNGRGNVEKGAAVGGLVGAAVAL